MDNLLHYQNCGLHSTKTGKSCRCGFNEDVTCIICLIATTARDQSRAHQIGGNYFEQRARYPIHMQLKTFCESSFVDHQSLLVIVPRILGSQVEWGQRRLRTRNFLGSNASTAYATTSLGIKRLYLAYGRRSSGVKTPTLCICGDSIHVRKN